MIISNQLNNSIYFQGRKKPSDRKVIAILSPECFSEKPMSEVYEDFLCNNPHTVIIDTSDKHKNRLNRLSEKYQYNQTIENKQRLLNQERKMLYEELEHPELTVTRNYADLSACFDEDTTPEDKKKLITLWNISALHRIESLSINNSQFPTTCTEKKIQILKKVAHGANGNTKIDALIKKHVCLTMNILYQSTNNDKQKKIIEDFLKVNDKDLYNNTHEKNNSKQLQELKENIEQPELFKNTLLTSSKENKEELTQLVQDVLTHDDCSEEIKELAVWGAGKYRSDKSFNIIKNIALNKDEKNIRLRHFAIQSSALYLRERPDEIVDMMDRIGQDGTIFAPLGKLLKDKVQGNYHTNLYREFDYQSFPEDGKKVVYDFVNAGKILSDSEINYQKLSKITGDLSYFKNAIQKGNVKFQDTYILNDTYTSLNPYETGKRLLENDLNSGDYFDSIEGINDYDFILMGCNRIRSPKGNGVIAHEYAHKYNEYFDKKDLKTQNLLFQQANKNNNYLDYYASLNELEYLAIGVQAYATTYLPHSIIIKNNSLTRYDLLEKDPDLYNFIEKVLNKY